MLNALLDVRPRTAMHNVPDRLCLDAAEFGGEGSDVAGLLNAAGVV